eukprot:CAMPEP_0198288206 /NCGR_PEP_ID=MMETSP1449-20131203/6797_1 /TAXON_ID=420275 /ORGANISM="Attheya septentrionalis, Strain CCMP2084" /LENGTH=334 /DNA_ID=CAMNT_0043986319 /DNA_START=66 /DNA_END=1070 /DNA_ORIENTATION=+
MLWSPMQRSWRLDQVARRHIFFFAPVVHKPLLSSTATSTHRAWFTKSAHHDPRLGMTIHPSHRRRGPRRLRAISMDVTGTIVAFNGRLEEHYANAARFCHVPLTHDEIQAIGSAFGRAYKETSRQHPCFGNDKMSAKDWWRICVLRSFQLAGIAMPSRACMERVFQRVYSTFGSPQTYRAFEDAIPFLKWAWRKRLVCGVISNADERYGDSILPMLGLTDHLQFLVFSKEVGFPKPHARIYQEAMLAAEPWLGKGRKWGRDAAPLVPSEVLHIGNDYEKDYVGATKAGFHAVLLARFDNAEAQEWREKGAPVFTDLMDVIEALARDGYVFGPKL